MNFQKNRRPMTIMLILILLITVAFSGIVANAADTTSSATQSAEPPSGASPSGGAPPSEGAPGGTPPSGNPQGQTASGGGISDGGKPEGPPPSEGKQSGAAPSGGMPAEKGGADTMTFDYKGTYNGVLIADGKSVTSDGESYTASEADQNVALSQNAGILTVTNSKLKKSGDDTNGDNCNFYGLNSILLAVNSGSAIYVSGSSLDADSEGSNGIFATDNAKIYSNNNTISTTAGNSRGLDATYGGTILANLMKISTLGDHSASVATDRGGGAISVTNSDLSTEGSGSPLLYSTGDIEVDNVTGTATGSQIAGMEGLNKILIYNSTLTSANTGKTASDPMADGVIIYQSTSGDAESTTGEKASFEASDSTLKSAITSGTMFYLTNTKANIVLSNTILDFDSSKANLLTVQGNDSNNWGTPGSNGAEAQFTGLGETLSGDISVDTISSLKLYLLKGTTYTGAVSVSANTVNTDVSSEPIAMNLDSSSKWILTGDSTVTSLNAEPGASIVDQDGNTVSIVANGEVMVKGTSNYTVTVTGSYSNTVTTDSSNQLSKSYINRTEFDNYYGVKTTFGTNETSDSTPNQTTSGSAADTHTLPYIITAAAILALASSGVILYRKKRNS